MDTLDEAVEGIGQHAEFVVAGDVQALGQVAFALGDVLHGAAHVGQRCHQHADQHAQQEQDGNDGDDRGDDRGVAEVAEHGVGGVLVEHQRDVPGHAWQAFHRRHGDQLLLAIDADFLHARLHLGRALRVDLGEVLEDQAAVGVQQNLAGVADQEGVAVAVEFQRVDDRGDGFQLHVAGGHADQLAVAHHRHGHGENLLVGAGIEEGLGDDQPAGGHGVLVPAAGARVVAVGHRRVGPHGEHAAGGFAQVHRFEALLEHLLLQHMLDALGRRFAIGQLCSFGFHQLDAAFQPALDIAGGQAADLGEVGFGVGMDCLALAEIVEDDETGEGKGDHQGGGQENLPGEGQRTKHG